MGHAILAAIARASFTPLGWFAPGPEDGVPGGAGFVILIGNAGRAMFRRFAKNRDPRTESLDAWTREAVGALAEELEAEAAFPFDKPALPFLAWARRAGAGFASPLGMNIHPTYGLWHAFRAALLFPAAIDLPEQPAGRHPCEGCARPCLTACPVGAFTGAAYDVSACARHIAAPEGAGCMAGGCLARRACPVGQTYVYAPAQAHFHMRAFLAARSGG
jgi:epoxyqueuosine reductase QueG